MSDPIQLSVEEVARSLPHGVAFRFVDTVRELVPGVRIHAQRKLRTEEPYFAGHFPGQPIMPGVLLGEALAQACGLLAGHGQKPVPIFHLAAIQLKFGGTAFPGDMLELKARADKVFGVIHQFEVEALAGEVTVASGKLMLAEVRSAV